MSDHNGNTEINGTDPISTSNAEETAGVKKGPPVAPKPAWVRQSLRSIKSGKLPAEAFKNPEIRSKDTGRSFGVSLRAPSSGTNLSFKQKLSSFETFSNTDGSERTSRRLPPSSSLPQTEKGPARYEKEKPIETSNAFKSGTTVINTQNNDKPSSVVNSPTTTKPLSEEQAASKKPDFQNEIPKTDYTTVATKPTDDTASSSVEGHSSLEDEKETSSTQKDEEETRLTQTDDEETAQEHSAHLDHCPRRSSSSKDPPSQKLFSLEDDSSHTASLRTRSLPLNTSSVSDAHGQGGLEGQMLEIILSFSNQVSHALMRSMQSLPQSPCLNFGNPWSAPSGSSHHNPTEDDDSTEAVLSSGPDSTEKGFSVWYGLSLSIPEN